MSLEHHTSYQEELLNDLPAVFVLKRDDWSYNYLNMKAKELLDLHPQLFVLLRMFCEERSRFYLLDGKTYQFYHQEKEDSYVLMMVEDTSMEFGYKVLEGSPIGYCRIIMKDKPVIGYANPAMRRMFGLGEEELTLDILENSLEDEEPIPLVKKVHDGIRNREEQMEGSVFVYGRDGKKRWVDVRIAISYETQMSIYVALLDKTKEHEHAEQLKLQEQRYQVALSLTSTCVWEYDIKKRCIYQTDSSLRRYGITETTIDNVPYSLVACGHIHPEFAEEFYRMYDKLFVGEPRVEWVGKIRNGEGKYLWTKVIYSTVYDSDHRPVRAVGISEDVDEAMRIKLLYNQELQYRNVMIEGSISAYEVDLCEDRFLAKRFCKTELLREVGVDFNGPYSAFVQKRVHIDMHDDDFLNYYATLNKDALLRAYEEEIHELRCTYRVMSLQEDFAWVEVLVHLIKNPENEHIIGFFCTRNIDEQKRHELQLIRQAEHDALTGLYNRTVFEQNVKKNLTMMELQAMPSALCMIDIDDFKKINDTYGHLCGDAILHEVSSRLLDVVQEQGMVARLGGDEFLCLLTYAVSKDSIEHTLKTLCERLNEEMTWEYGKVTPAVSIGCVIYHKSMPYEELYRLVDEELYHAKEQGKNRYALRVVE